ncbi:MAG TPA: molecular chaperone DnaJ [Chromatiaceae bacterium]|nr:molecular chaperone DnaJ [Chromatiaceae bacterium]
MPARIIVILAIIALVLWGLHWFRRTPSAQVAAGLRKAAIYGGIGLLVVLVVSGRLSPILAALAAAVPAVMRLANLLRLFPALQQLLRSLGVLGVPGAAGGMGSLGGGQSSAIQTRFIDMTLDHGSGRMDGTVREGPSLGRRLSDLGLDELLALLNLCRAQDPQSAAVLEAYLDRERGDWRDSYESPAAGPQVRPSTTMDRAEALRVLGLAEGARPDQVRAAHRSLMQRFHPDRGGSDYLAAMINEAKRVLMGD